MPADLLDGGTAGCICLPPGGSLAHPGRGRRRFRGAPGDLVRLPASQVPARIGLKLSEHQVRFREVLALMDLLRITPRDFLVLGVQPRSSRWGETLSPEVEAAIPEAVQQIGKQVAAWANSGERHPLSPGDRLLGSRL